MPTRREEIERLLKERPFTPKQLADLFGAEIDEIVEDLGHVKLSVKHPFRFKFHPSQCRGCGFLFKDRPKLKTPSKCPECRSESIAEATFFIEREEK